MQVEHQKIDNLAEMYSNKKSDLLFNALYKELEIYLEKEAKNSEFRAKSKGVTIPKEDFISAYSIALWQASKMYKPKSHFIQRLYYFMKFREADVWRNYRSSGTMGDKDGIRYDKARWQSLDKEINESDTTLGEHILISNISAEEEFIEKLKIKEIFDLYQKINQRYAQVIKLIYLGYSPKEVALLIGEKSYNEKTRKLVQRAKKNFYLFLSNNSWF